MYVAVKGGEQAIENAHRLMAEERRGAQGVPELTVEQILQQMRLAVDRVMSEGALYDPWLAALAVKQARGDLVEATFLLRAYRTTLPRLYDSLPVDTTAMEVRRRVSATFKDIPGGQVLGPTFDYTHRLLDFGLAAESRPEPAATVPDESLDESRPPLSRVMDLLAEEGLVDRPGGDGCESEDETRPVGDITRDPLTYPAARDVRLQNLARGDEGFLLALGYSSQRGFGDNHPFAGEIRMGEVAVSIRPDELGFEVEIGDVTVSECEMVTSFKGSKDELPRFTRGYGLSFGYNERKVLAMSLVDRSLQARELGEDINAPSRDEEFVLSHSDNVEAQGFVQHLKLPHYVDFQADLVMVRGMRAEILKRAGSETEEAA
ncbi:Alpha-D-ribose 1-methylphosphonate 5-triphosphate synthase subunit PhnI [Pseudodesulfovibrio hydrargyri]|uniref:Alpha-D-ribose 1-methylphosphonate 5-triphosphate synthase subunit PhnI n=1 Tax=Pseudodesulfovibrio hydrargyri TaxID=2125990 RepID=A0A1J5MTC5_9BACT|nr:carbon-phosphorus lyase complex subunit PhnI [Pseudodesulfovibrio hydrargyri]OIQ49869.1 Alpha-D-ribose 1-methylphosphonate 5-triphosphate synthase subunit PhnI [Pseudodesulfovibrio hydrargyri]